MGFPKGQTDRENRPHFLDPVKGANSRISKIYNTIKAEQPDILLLQEVHDEGNQIDEHIINGLSDQFSTFYTHTLRGQKVLGSGLLVATRYKNTSFEMVPFTSDGGADRKYVHKGFGIISVRDNNDKLVMRVVNTHMQSGPTDSLETTFDGCTMTYGQIRNNQMQQVITTLNQLDAQEKASVNIIGGDFNADRASGESFPRLQDGFTKEQRVAYTQLDLGQTPKAYDNIVSLPGKHKMVTRVASPFTSYNDPSDHAALVTTITGYLNS